VNIPPNGASIKVLIVDDSQVAQMLLRHVLEADPGIQILGMVGNGVSALEILNSQVPDVILMDIHMPGMDGFEVTRRIMETHPVPIVICSGVANMSDVTTAFRTMEAGAVACVEKPGGPERSDYETVAANLRQTVRLMSEVKVVRRWSASRMAALHVATPSSEAEMRHSAMRVVGIGASTGGPPVLQTILSALPRDFPVPILVVQHIAHGFLAGLADWLKQTTAFQVHIGAHGISPLAGHVYLAPDDFHMGISNGGRIALSKMAPENSLRPAVSFLFRSLATVCGPGAVGVLLTGMGRDGADDLKRMKDAGAVTIAQDKESSIVHGMPGEAIAIGGATHVLPPEKIATRLASLFAPPHRSGDT
jgi:two-component system chemotaxis response regulator CheB